MDRCGLGGLNLAREKENKGKRLYIKKKPNHYASRQRLSNAYSICDISNTRTRETTIRQDHAFFSFFVLIYFFSCGAGFPLISSWLRAERLLLDACGGGVVFVCVPYVLFPFFSRSQVGLVALPYVTWWVAVTL